MAEVLRPEDNLEYFGAVIGTHVLMLPGSKSQRWLSPLLSALWTAAQRIHGNATGASHLDFFDFVLCCVYGRRVSKNWRPK